MLLYPLLSFDVDRCSLPGTPLFVRQTKLIACMFCRPRKHAPLNSIPQMAFGLCSAGMDTIGNVTVLLPCTVQCIWQYQFSAQVCIQCMERPHLRETVLRGSTVYIIIIKENFGKH